MKNGTIDENVLPRSMKWFLNVGKKVVRGTAFANVLAGEYEPLDYKKYRRKERAHDKPQY